MDRCRNLNRKILFSGTADASKPADLTVSAFSRVGQVFFVLDDLEAVFFVARFDIVVVFVFSVVAVVVAVVVVAFSKFLSQKYRNNSAETNPGS